MRKGNKILIIIIMFLPSFVFAQSYLTEDIEQDIKLSGKYYWEEGYDFDETKACQIALKELTNRIISDAVNQTNNREDFLRELEIDAHLNRIRQEGMICIIAWIVKDSVFVTSQGHLNKLQESAINSSTSTVFEPSSTSTFSDMNTSKTDDIVLQELLKCKNYKEINKVINRRGLVKGEMNSSEGFDRPDLCYIAIFDTNGLLKGLLDRGNLSRKDLISGQKIQNPESYFRNEGYNLLYLQRK